MRKENRVAWIVTEKWGRGSFEDILREAEFEISRVDDPVLMVRRGKGDAPDLLVMSMYRDGDETLRTLRRIRAEEKLQHVPLILISASGEAPDNARYLRAGADEVFPREGDREMLRARVEALLRISRAQKKIREKHDKVIRIETLKQTLATLTHHINNSLSTISGKAQLCSSSPDIKKNYEELVQICLKETRRIEMTLGSLYRVVEKKRYETTDLFDKEHKMIDLEGMYSSIDRQEL